MRLGLVGYGSGGRYFHAPFIDAAEGVDLAGVVTRSAARRDQVAAEHPGVPVYGSLKELAAAGVDAVTITTPPETRRELVLEAVAAGLHVVADKPFAPTADDARDLARAAVEAGVVLNVFHNRRWDTDLRTVKAVIVRARKHLGHPDGRVGHGRRPLGTRRLPGLLHPVRGSGPG